ncbi:MAG: SH3 domain-containing protein [Pilosibacter sp.]
MSDKYLLFGTDIEPLAKELGLLSAKITATTLNVREIPSTDSAILKQAAEGDSFPVLSESDGWTKVQLSADTNGYISSKYASIGPVPAAAVDAKEESAALSASGNGTSAAPSYVISATEDEIYLMAACVAMEAGDDSYEDKLAVASCIVNRVKSGKWGKTISDVIYADGQFPGASSGLLDKYLCTKVRPSPA